MCMGGAMTTCPHCGHSLPKRGAGVRLTPLKARIYEAVRRAGPAGIDADELFGLIYGGTPASRWTLKAHIWQINDVLQDPGRRILGQRGNGGRYRLARHV